MLVRGKNIMQSWYTFRFSESILSALFREYGLTGFIRMKKITGSTKSHPDDGGEKNIISSAAMLFSRRNFWWAL